jgi:hypothetical protein
MQAQAAKSSGDAGQPPPLFELWRVRRREKGPAIAKRRRIPLLFEEKNLKTVCLNSFILNQAQHHFPADSILIQGKTLMGNGARLSSPR